MGIRDRGLQLTADKWEPIYEEWVAVKDGQLVSHGSNAKEVHQAAKDAGLLDALLVLVEASNVPAFIL
jgi:hypothetical protein